ncbi:MAG: helix-turn-helix domain-containing protein [Burkholderiales bacterium]|nr:helix-turn-helix domain-containing protein [Burkholderiales bacterium]
MTDTSKDDLFICALTEAQLAERWSISRKTLQAWRLRGGGPRFVRIGSAIRYMLSDITAYEAANTHSSTTSVASSNIEHLEV